MPTHATLATVSLRRLSRAEAALLAEDIKQVPGITGYPPDELLRLPTVLVLQDRGQLAGVLAYLEMPHCIDLKLFLVRPQFRAKGFGTRLFAAFTDHFAATRKPIYLVTKNPVVIHLARAAGYERVSFLQLPLPCSLHQLKLLGSWYRAREYVRKRVAFRHSGSFSYWLKRHE